jgi:p-cumate 2,3-dioxygenase alpha subunit
MRTLLDAGSDRFRVPRKAYVDQALFEQERDRIFDRSWLYLGHASELEKPGDYVARAVAGRNLIFCRDREGVFRAFFNACPHRGATVCRERKGNTKSFQCLYHGWIYGTDGKNKDLPGREAYPADFVASGRADLTPVPRLADYRGFWFVSFDPGIGELDAYLGAATPFLDSVCDQSAVGMTIVGGTQEYAIRANWKLLVENSYDGYHAVCTHATYLDYLRNTNGGLTNVRLEGRGFELGGGHGAVEYKAPWGRPVAQWIPMWGEEGRAEIDRVRSELEARVGPERASRIAEYNRNLGIFPNLVVNDIMAITIRTFYPVAPDCIQVNAWALAPREEGEWARRYRLYNFLEFLGPGGFATPDDIEALEQCQRGFQNLRETPWSDISKGVGREIPSYDDEAHIRSFWTEWDARMAPVAEAAE